ncbi:MAG: branched-chain amino acid transaminase [Xanthomonadales bacterium]|jgi:branched-chain amino acid aminotransferase|nr:branched-chain amino acid transaminase [Xanthomonadales bacterium]
MSHNFPAQIWHQGKLKPWAEATVHVMAHALHYGSSVFEGIRSYRTTGGGYQIFRLDEHIQRLFDSARIYDMPMPYDFATLKQACFDVLNANSLDEAYLRPIAFRSAGGFGLGADNPVECSVAAWVWGPYLGEAALKEGVDACISTWRRVAPATLPAAAKAGGNYLSSILISREAKRLGFHEGIALTVDGYVAEGAGENVFVIKKGVVYTPPLAASILHGITRDTAITLLQEDLGVEVREMQITREILYLADELFMTGTAAEITPIRSVDRKTIGSGEPGPLTRRLQERFFGIQRGEIADTRNWIFRG